MSNNTFCWIYFLYIYLILLLKVIYIIISPASEIIRKNNNTPPQQAAWFEVLVMRMREWEWALLARYVYTYEEFVIVTEAPQCNRMTNRVWGLFKLQTTTIDLSRLRCHIEFNADENEAVSVRLTVFTMACAV